MMIGELMSDLRKRRQARARDFNELARHLAAGRNSVKPETVETLLAAEGKTEAELAAAVAVVTRRIDLAKAIAEAETAASEEGSLAQRRHEAGLELDAAKEKYRETVGPINDRLSQIAELRRAAKDARRELLSACPYPELIEARARLGSELGRLRSKQAELRAVLLREKEIADYENLAADGGPRTDQTRALAARLRRAIDAAKSDLPEVENQIARVAADLAAVEEQMLKP